MAFLLFRPAAYMIPCAPAGKAAAQREGYAYMRPPEQYLADVRNISNSSLPVEKTPQHGAVINLPSEMGTSGDGNQPFGTAGNRGRLS